MCYAVVFKMEELQPYEAIATGNTSEKLKQIDLLASKYNDVKIQLEYPYCKYIFTDKNALDFFIEAKNSVEYIDIEKLKEGVKQCQKKENNLN